MLWLQQAASLLTGGHLNVCQAGHDSHRTIVVDCAWADGPTDTIPNRPAVRRHPMLPATFEVFDADLYKGEPGYCTGDDEVSRTVAYQGVWDGYGSALTRVLLDDAPSVTIDMGAHIGWYTTLAAALGHQVLAVEPDPDNLAVLRHNVGPWSHRVHPIRGWIGADSLPLPIGAPQVRFAKIDIEGAEHHALRILEPLLAVGLIDYLLVELTPAFGDTWREVVGRLDWAGYRGFVIPDGADIVHEYQADPLGVTLRNPLDCAALAERVQADVLFLRAVA